MIGIYKIESPSGKVYIGQSWNIDKRFDNYKRCRKEQPFIYNSIKKYGWENHKFEVVHELPFDITQSVLDSYEVLYWQQYKDCGITLMNAKEPGRGGRNSEETNIKISNSLIGNKRSLGFKHSKDTIDKRRMHLIGRECKDETKGKISNSLLGIKHSESRKDNISKGHNFQKKKIDIFYENREFYITANSRREASELTGVVRQNITVCCKNPNWKVKGFYFKYNNDEC